MTSAENSKRLYYHYKANGICVRCGELNDRKNVVLCSKCQNVQYNRQKEIRKWYTDNGICPVCRKEKLFGTEKRCLECNSKDYLYKQNHKPLELQKIKWANNFSDKQKVIYAKRAEEGICTKCGKYKAAQGRKKCYTCLDKDRLTQIKRRERISNGL